MPRVTRRLPRLRRLSRPLPARGPPSLGPDLPARAAVRVRRGGEAGWEGRPADLAGPRTAAALKAAPTTHSWTLCRRVGT